MEKKKCIYAIVLLAIIVIGASVVVLAKTQNVSFSVVMSQSMQHDQYRSSLGIIDTGDVVLVKDVDHSDIQSYVEGTKTGKKTFGDYGSVIIYDRGSDRNPVIHRAIVWLDFNQATNTWSSEDLKDYAGEWWCETSSGVKTTDWSNLSGTIYFRNLTQSGKNVEATLSRFTSSGFLTMGDNTANSTFDQNAGIINHLISMDNINSVPFAEIPWIGTLKIYFKNDGANLEHVPNSMPSLFMFIGALFALLLFIDALSLFRSSRAIHKELDTIIED